MSFLTGGSKQKSQSQATSTQQSGNLAYPFIQNAYSGNIDVGNRATSAIQALLGIGGDAGASQAAYKDYLGSTDYKFTTDAGNRMITNNQAVKGQLGSGATLRRLLQFGQDNQQKYFGDYLGRLLGLTNTGLESGKLITSAGNYSTGSSQSTSSSSGKSQGGLGDLIGAIASSVAASDRRLKLDIKKIGEQAGLGVYNYRYTWDKPGTVRTGYMADEVAELYPSALGPKLESEYLTVDYGQLPAIEV